MVCSATKQQALAGGKIWQLWRSKHKKVEQVKRAPDLDERSEAPNPGDQKGAAAVGGGVRHALVSLLLPDGKNHLYPSPPVRHSGVVLLMPCLCNSEDNY